MRDPAAGSAGPSSLRAALQRISGAAAQLLLTRLELAGVELTQAARDLLRWGGLGLAAAMLLLLALGCATAAVVAVLWQALGWLILAAFAVLYGAAAAALLLRIRSELLTAPAFLDATVAELRQDLELLQPRQSAPAEAAATADS